MTNTGTRVMQTSSLLWLLLLATVISPSNALVVPTSFVKSTFSSSSITQLFMASKSPREQRADEIRRKILTLKRMGKIQKKKKSSNGNYDDDDDLDDTTTPTDQLSDLEKLKRINIPQTSAAEDYADKLSKKRRAAYFLGVSTDDDDDDDDGDDELVPSSEQQQQQTEEEEPPKPTRRKGQLGSLAKKTSTKKDDDDDKSSSTKKDINILDPALKYVVGDEDEAVVQSMEEEDLVELVATKLREKRKRQDKERNERLRKMARETREMQEQAASRGDFVPSTTGVGGNWVKNGTAAKDTYKPSKSGSWGVFERPKDISKAYGGGRRIGAGYADEQELEKSSERTRKKLKAYLEKAGIEVQSEKDHADEIKVALAIASKAMDRGRYDTGISALEKVTKWCSTNSETGSKVFLELAMAYEAANRKDEAVAVYKELSTSRNVDVKVHAKRLLYGIEAIDFMRDEAGSKEFGPYGQRAGSDNDLSKYLSQKLASVNRDYFPDLVYAPYVDINKKRGRKSRRLSEVLIEAVDGPKEAFEILEQHISGDGVQSRRKLIESLRVISSAFDTALEQERKAEKLKNEVAVMNGRPISSYVTSSRQPPSKRELEFKLTSAERMMDRMDGEWKLQFTADRILDGSVQFFNQTSKSKNSPAPCWQSLEGTMLRFKFGGLPIVGPMTLEEYGTLDWNSTSRVLTRQPKFISNGLASKMFPNIGAASSLVPQQIMSVDKRMLLTRCSRDCDAKIRPTEETKDYFAVWSRVKRGTYSKKTRIL